MRVKSILFDFGNQIAFCTTRGPFQHAVRAPFKYRRRRVSVRTRRKAVALLKAWALSTTRPRDRLRIIRRRW